MTFWKSQHTKNCAQNLKYSADNIYYIHRLPEITFKKYLYYTSLTLRSIIIDVTQMMVTGIKNPSVTRYQAYDWCVGSCHDGAQLKKWKSFCLIHRFHPRCLLTNDYLGPFYLENCSKYFGFTESSKYKSFTIFCLNRSYSYDNSLVHQKC